jgi:uncharacterized membrane protein
VNPDERPKIEPVDHSIDDPDAVASRPIGTRSFVYGAKALAAALVALLLMLFVHDAFAAAFWVLLAAGLLGIMFSFIERSTTGGEEVVSHRRVNLDVLATVVLAVVVMAIVAILER